MKYLSNARFRVLSIHLRLPFDFTAANGAMTIIVSPFSYVSHWIPAKFVATSLYVEGVYLWSQALIVVWKPIVSCIVPISSSPTTAKSLDNVSGKLISAILIFKHARRMFAILEAIRGPADINFPVDKISMLVKSVKSLVPFTISGLRT